MPNKNGVIMVVATFAAKSGEKSLIFALCLIAPTNANNNNSRVINTIILITAFNPKS